MGRVLKSEEELLAAEERGDVALEQTEVVVNCPVTRGRMAVHCEAFAEGGKTRIPPGDLLSLALVAGKSGWAMTSRH